MSRVSRTGLWFLIISFAVTPLLKSDDGGGGNGPNSNPAATTGTVEKLPASGLVGVWTVSSHTITVSATTKIVQTNGPAAVGACVRIVSAPPVYYGNAATDGTAVEIDVISAAGGCTTAPVNQHNEVEFFGAVTKLPPSPAVPPGDWTIAGRSVHSGATTRLDLGASVQIGICAEVKGSVLSDGSVQASRIKVDSDGSPCSAGLANSPPMRFIGTVSALPSSTNLVGTWTISARSVVVGASARIEPEQGAMKIGSCVSVRGAVQGDSSIVASQIETEDASDCTPAQAGAGTFDVEGVVTSAPTGSNIGDWTIGKSKVRVNSGTVVDVQHGAVAVGACVEARGNLSSDGVLVAALLESTSSSGTCLLHNGIVNAASFTGGSVAPGQVISLFGLNIGSAAAHELQLDGDHVANNLSNVRVFFDGIAAPLLLVSPGQVNAVVPFEVAGKTTTAVQVQNNDVWSNVMVVPVSATAPAVFTLTQDGKGQGAVLNFDSDRQQLTVNAPSNAAQAGSVVVIYLTGTGPSDLTETDGTITGAQLARVLQQVKVSFGGKEGEVLYAGSAPNLVAGVRQINVRIPADSSKGASVPVVVTVGDHHSQDGVTIAIR